MITEDYISFEVAKLLRDKGFDAKCRYYYIQTGEMFEVDTRFHTVLTTQELLDLQIVGEKEERCVAPTLQMAMKWLREVHKLGVFPSTYTNIKGSNTTHVYGTAIVNLNTYELVTSDCMARDTYEEACEVAIKYCLENLI